MMKLVIEKSYIETGFFQGLLYVIFFEKKFTALKIFASPISTQWAPRLD